MSETVYVDSHAHLDDEAFDHDRDEVVAATAAAGVRCVINVGYKPDSWRKTIDLIRRYPLARHMLGLHPQHAGEWSRETRNQLMTLIETTSPVAIGEIGLDYFRAGPTPEQQNEAFAAQLDMAREIGLPIVIHQRAAEDDLADVLTRVDWTSQVLLHSFEGTNRLAFLARDRGFYVGVGGLATRGSADGLRQTLRSIPLDRVLLETDSPYLAPAGSKHRRNTPASVPLIAERLAPLWEVDQETFAAATTENAERLFGPLVANGQRGPTVSQQ